ncbi:MBL fold metallo-hydrolase [Chitinivorax sp. B]|uniref:MBL fold metallo-hydrolase n=1 Tax=Chitinivorax sp. B TaxID=2502235 RepID=UPI0010F58D4F|nr:MBL fold metallo-hydrolase [Chitinivorax sp. B]
MEITLLGTGSSAGTPVIGCECGTCTSPDPRNKRTRASALLQVNGFNLLIDTGPDLRLQALRENFKRVDAVLYTHPHADHLNGIDDLRAFCYHQRAAIPIYGNPFTIDDIRNRFAYCFFPPGRFWDKPILDPRPVEGPFEFQGVQIIPIPLVHGRWIINGYRIGNVAYLTDLNEIPDSSWALLHGLDVLLLDCLKEQPYPSHFGVDQAIDHAQRIGAAQTYLIHMTHDLEYHALQQRLPGNIAVGYDGLRINV